MGYYRLIWNGQPNPFDKSLLPKMEAEIWTFDVYKEGRYVGRIKTNPRKDKVESAIKSLLGELRGNVEATLVIDN